MAIYNPKPIKDRLPSKTKEQIAVAAKAGVSHKTLLRIAAGESANSDSIESVVRATEAPYSEVFSEQFFIETNPN